MEKAIFVGQIVVSALLLIAILLQQRGSGLSSVFGGTGNIYRTKRGLEKGLFFLTIILILFFVAIGIVNLLVQPVQKFRDSPLGEADGSRKAVAPAFLFALGRRGFRLAVGPYRREGGGAQGRRTVQRRFGRQPLAPKSAFSSGQ